MSAPATGAPTIGAPAISAPVVAQPPVSQVPLPPEAQLLINTPGIAASAATPSVPGSSVQPSPLQAPVGSLWQRIRNGFALPDLQSERVQKWEQYYSGKPDYVQRMAMRGSRYLFHIVEEVEKRGMPLELALLPFAESAFNPQAMSSAKASGIWQFMPATGKDFRLRQNLFRDDRRDVLASTSAALDYLQRLHGMVGGDWQLALAAYNWGVGNVQRAMANNKRAGLGTGYDSLTMPDETRNYVPKLQALKNLVLAPNNWGLQLPPLQDQPFFRSVPIDQDIDVARAASMARISIEDFHALNPQMNKPVILAAGTPQVLLPFDNASKFALALASATGPLATWTAWVAPTTLKTADAARRVGMSEEHLREVNRIPARMMVKAGSTLLVPRGTRTTEDVSTHVADNAAIALAPEPVPQRRVAFKAGKRDTVASVAQRYQLAATAVAGWNKVAPGAKFKAGQTVVVMLPGGPRAGAKGNAKGQSTTVAAKPAAAVAARAPGKASPSRANRVDRATAPNTVARASKPKATTHAGAKKAAAPRVQVAAAASKTKRH